MPQEKKQKNDGLDAYFMARSFVIDSVDEPIDVIQKWRDAFEEDKYKALFHLGFLEKEKWFSPAVEYLHHIAQLFIKKISQQPDLELSREHTSVDLNDEILALLKEEVPFAVGMQYIDKQWLYALWQCLLEAFQWEIKNYSGSVAKYLTDHNANIHVAGKVYFHMVESKDEAYPFAFMATYSTKPAKSNRAIHTPLKNALTEFNGDENKLLKLISSVVKSAEKSDLISSLLESGELFYPIQLDEKEAYTFLKELPLYEASGIMCRVPNWWSRKNNALRLSIQVGEKVPSRVGLDALMDFTPSFCLGDEQLSEEELRAFLEMSEGLTRYKGMWVEVNRKKLEAALQAFEKVKAMKDHTPLSLAEAMRLELNVNELIDLPTEEIDIEVSNGQWFKQLKDQLTRPAERGSDQISLSFKANLRPYQEKGYYWLNQMNHYGFGACLADDMGLGKTVQLIAFLEQKRIAKAAKALLVLPASLLGNWQKEIEKFAPEMPYQILHQSSLKKSEKLELNDEAFLYITTYGMAIKLEELSQRQWDFLILDEAQAIKNPGTKQTKAIKAIPSTMRIALTGTPIENKLGDLWSLFDFLNQGLLGTRKDFSAFAKDLNSNATGYAKLRRMISPFILRRLKTDKCIISDLPEKVEVNAYTQLSRKQTALYKQLIKEIELKLETTEGIERKGLVLSSIIKFKQICNHPDHYLGREEYKAEQSGKFQQLKEIGEIIYEKRERLLVFTQFREMTEPIAEFLRGIFSKEGLILHGGTPVKQRQKMVEQFNGEQYIPFMVLSLKAGGVGLNLTAANHVIHFDRWWNPAVENQATDRAFRIGQSKNVIVHKFVTQGTIEEKIDAIIADKQKLSGDLLSSTSEQWITEYSNDQLMKIFALESDN